MQVVATDALAGDIADVFQTQNNLKALDRKPCNNFNCGCYNCDIIKKVIPLY